jgi:hypothetical protein
MQMFFIRNLTVGSSKFIFATTVGHRKKLSIIVLVGSTLVHDAFPPPELLEEKKVISGYQYRALVEATTPSVIHQA